MILDVPTAAVEAGVGRSTIHKWVKAGHIEAVATNPVRVRAADVRQAIDTARQNQLANLDKRHAPREHL